MDEELNDRLTELEIRYSYQSQLLEELDKVVADCNLRIDRLVKENQSLRQMVARLAVNLEESPDE